MEKEINFEISQVLSDFLYRVTRGFFIWGGISMIFYILVIFSFVSKIDEYSKKDILFLLGAFILIGVHFYGILNQFFGVKNTISKIFIKDNSLIIESYDDFFLMKINKQCIKTNKDSIKIQKCLYPIRDKFLKEDNIYLIQTVESNKKYYLLMDFFDSELKTILFEK